MKSLIVYASVHHGNTEKIALAIADVLNADTVKASEAYEDLLTQYDVIGIGSGIFFGKFHKQILGFVEKTEWRQKKVFVFSTSGFGKSTYNDPLIEFLQERNAEIVGQFHCKGYDTNILVKPIGGLAKGHPDETDVRAAREFANKLME